MGFLHKKSLGQHFLNSPVVPGWMCDAADLKEGETVFEIGPGSGVLTRELLSRGVTVIALEADERAIDVLKETFSKEISTESLIVHHGDARSIDFDLLNLTDHSYKCVSNIPYYLSGHLFRTMLETKCQPSDLIFLVQKEVAQRIARDEKESLLSLATKVYGEVKYEKTVKAGHFTPPPKVDSAIVSITSISRKNFESVSQEVFFKILHLGFAAKRKQLLGNLAKEFDRDLLTNIFSTLEIDNAIRGEDLPLDKWLSLVEKIDTHKAPTDTQV